MTNYTYYLDTNSGSGYVSFFDEAIQEFKKIIVLEKISRNNKIELFDSLKNVLKSNDISYDTIMRCGYGDEFDALIIKDMSTVIADENLFTQSIPLFADIIDFSGNADPDVILYEKRNDLKKRMSDLKSKSFSHLAQARLIHDEWEKIYISNIDFEKIDDASSGLIDSIFLNVADSGENRVKNAKRFFGSLLPRGSINFIDELTGDIEKRIFIKGRPGTGKSTILKKIVASANCRGYDAEIYYCALDPQSLDMVVIRELGVCIFDSTEPHEKFPCRENDILFDVYDIGVNKDTDVLYSDELMRISSMYNSEIKKAKECLYTASVLRKKYDKLIMASPEQSNKLINKVIALASLSR